MIILIIFVVFFCYRIIRNFMVSGAFTNGKAAVFTLSQHIPTLSTLCFRIFPWQPKSRFTNSNSDNSAGLTGMPSMPWRGPPGVGGAPAVS